MWARPLLEPAAAVSSDVLYELQSPVNAERPSFRGCPSSDPRGDRLTTKVHASMSVGIHGTLDMHPWIAAARDRGELVDAFSLLAMRSSALGMASFGNAQDTSGTSQWGHADADDTWDQDGPARDLVWHHVVVPPSDEVARLRLPIQSLLSVVDSSLDRLGTTSVHAVRAFLPLQLARQSWRELTHGHGWLALAAPRAGSITVDITIEASERARITERIGDVVNVLAQAVGDDVDVRIRPGIVMPSRFSTWETLPMYGRRDVVGLRCDVQEWSTPFAAWLIEVIVNACLDARIDDPLLIDAARVD